MAVFRVERNTGYTVMSNHHLRNKELSLKAKGLLSQMLSLPEDWDYTLAGLSDINRESIDAIRTAVWELAKKVFPYSLLQRKAPFCQTYAKEKRCNLKKITTLPKAYSIFVFDFCNFFRCCGDNPYACIAHIIKKRVKLPPLCVFLRLRI